MNEKTYRIVIICSFIIGIVLGIFIIIGFGNSEVDRLSNAITSGQEINRRLQISNTYLSNINNRLTKEIGELEERIITDNRDYQERLGKISSGLGTISEGLGGTGKDLQSIIEGLEGIKKGLREIKKAK